MPIHDWSKVDAGLYHSFHQSWSVTLMTALNDGRLPRDYFAVVEKRFEGTEPDVLTLRDPARSRNPNAETESGGVATLAEPPKASYVMRAEETGYAAKANVIKIRRGLGEIVAAIEIVSPGNKKSKENFRLFLKKNLQYLRQGIHLLIVDLFPPTRRDPQGMHAVLWKKFSTTPFVPPAGKPLTVVSYEAAQVATAYVEPVAVGEVLRDMPLYFAREKYIMLPLESTYMAAWNQYPESYRRFIESA